MDQRARHSRDEARRCTAGGSQLMYNTFSEQQHRLAKGEVRSLWIEGLKDLSSDYVCDCDHHGPCHEESTMASWLSTYRSFQSRYMPSAVAGWRSNGSAEHISRLFILYKYVVKGSLKHWNCSNTIRLLSLLITIYSSSST